MFAMLHFEHFFGAERARALNIMVQDPFGHEGPFQRIKKKNEYGTQGVYTGQHVSCDHMERRLRQNRDSHGKRGETQVR